MAKTIPVGKLVISIAFIEEEETEKASTRSPSTEYHAPKPIKQLLKQDDHKEPENLMECGLCRKEVPAEEFAAHIEQCDPG